MADHLDLPTSRQPAISLALDLGWAAILTLDALAAQSRIQEPATP